MRDIKLYAIGDSLTAGFPFDEDFSFPALISKNLGCVSINLGVNGESSGEILSRITATNIFDEEDKESDHLKIATILCGSNDFIFQGQVEVSTLMNTLQIAKYCKDNKVIPLVLSPMQCNAQQAKNSWIDNDLIDYNKVNVSILKYEKMLQEACMDERFDFDFLSMQKVYSAHSSFIDGLHPDKLGYEIMAQAIGEKLVEIASR